MHVRQQFQSLVRSYVGEWLSAHPDLAQRVFEVAAAELSKVISAQMGVFMTAVFAEDVVELPTDVLEFLQDVERMIGATGLTMYNSVPVHTLALRARELREKIVAHAYQAAPIQDVEPVPEF